MKYEELVEKVRKAAQKAKVSREIEHLAYQFNVEGEAQGAFYLEIVKGKINVEPYEYYDRDIIIITSADVLLQIMDGKLPPMVAYTNDQIRVHGDVELLKFLPVGYEGKTVNKINTTVDKEVDKEVDKL